MKRKLGSIFLALLFLIGFGVLVYPTVSDQWNTYRQSQLINGYNQSVQAMEQEDFSQEWDAAKAFNKNLKKNDIYGDVFGTIDADIKQTDYWKILNLTGDGIMGYLSIPSINIKLAIYHGTAEDVLQTGIGHMNGTKLPIGGADTHSVLAAHRGLPSARLFTDADQLVKGDRIYIHMLDEVLAYEVDQILDMVGKDDQKTLEKAMAIEKGEDYITLFTCTPYGVNSHRLLVRGTRIPYDGSAEAEKTVIDNMVEAVRNYYMIYLILGLAVTLLGILIIRFFVNKKDEETKKTINNGNRRK